MYIKQHQTLVEKLCQKKLQIVALSATITNLEEVSKKYIGNGTVITTQGKREIEVIGTPWENKTTEITLIDYLSTNQSDEKILCFCNKRKRVDGIAKEMQNKLKQLGYETYSHHGSLSKNLRERAEKKMKESGKCVLFATTTLEIGIDIGNIDLVVLDEPAHDIPGLLQRIGRGNRRTNQTRVMPCTSSEIESLIHESMIRAAKDGWLGPDKNGPQSGVAIQQIMSYIFQSPTKKRSRESIEKLLAECASEQNQRLLIDHLIENHQLAEKPDGLWLVPEWLDKTEYGKIHVTIEGTPGLEVIDHQTGEAIASDITYKSGKYMHLGGKGYEVKKHAKQKLEVTENKKNASDATWDYLSKPWFNGPSQPQAVKRHLQIPQDTWPIITTPTASYIFHFGGAPRKSVLELALTLSNQKMTDYKINNWYIETFPDTTQPPKWITNATPSLIELAIGERLPSLEHTLGRPRINQQLPYLARIEEITGWLNIEQEIKEIQTSKWDKCIDEQLIIKLLMII